MTKEYISDKMAIRKYRKGVEKMSSTFNNYVLKRLVDAADKLIEEHNFSMEEACKIENITVEEYKEYKEKNSMLI